MKKITYSKSGVDYQILDNVKKLARIAALKTKQSSNSEVSQTRGESAFVFKENNLLVASVIEGLGTKNLIADEAGKNSKKTYYDVIGHDTVATIINDLITVGAQPKTINAYWAVGNTNWLKNKKKINDLITGWQKACIISNVVWGGGETPNLKGIITDDAIDLAGSASGIISPKSALITENKLKAGDRILLIGSNGINSNGISLVRALAKKLKQGLKTKLSNKKTFAEAILTKTNIYARLVNNLQNENIEIHYISNITGHGLRKIMRAKKEFTYYLEKVFEPQEIFEFIQKNANLSDYEMYETFNMGQDYAIFMDKKFVEKAQNIVKKNNFKSLDAGFIKKGPRQVIIEPKKIVFKSETLNLK